MGKTEIISAVIIISLVKFIQTDELSLLIHPRYFILTKIAIALLLLITFFASKSKQKWMTMDVIVVVILLIGCFIGIRPLTSSADQGGASTFIPQQASRMRRFAQFNVDTKQFTMKDWIVYLSEHPDALLYKGRPANVEGFYHVTPDGERMIARYVLNCCVADARIIGVPISKPIEANEGDWVKVSGVFLEEGDRAVLYPEIFEKLKAPKDFYITF